MAEGEALVAVFYSHMAAEDAVRRLHLIGYDIKRLSIVLQNDTLVERVAGFYTAQERILSWGKTGAVCGTVAGLLAGTTLIIISGIEAGAVADSALFWIRSALGAGVATGGLSALLAGIYSSALPKGSVLKFEPQVEAGNSKFFLMARSTATEAAAARRSLWSGAPWSSSFDEDGRSPRRSVESDKAGASDGPRDPLRIGA